MKKAALFLFLVLLTNISLAGTKNTNEVLRPFVKLNNASGVIIKSWRENDENYSYVLTAEHVIHAIGDKTKIPADFFLMKNNGKIEALMKLYGETIEINQEYDFAIIKYHGKIPMVSARCAAEDEICVMDDVHAVGAPNGQTMWVSHGIISALTVPDFGYLGYIGHDAKIHFGNSGGPLYNKKHQLIAINLRVSAYRVIKGGESEAVINHISFSLPIHIIYKLIGADKVGVYFNVN